MGLTPTQLLDNPKTTQVRGEGQRRERRHRRERIAPRFPSPSAKPS
jgi:hypothetical protein